MKVREEPAAERIRLRRRFRRNRGVDRDGGKDPQELHDVAPPRVQHPVRDVDDVADASVNLLELARDVQARRDDELRGALIVRVALVESEEDGERGDGGREREPEPARDDAEELARLFATSGLGGDGHPREPRRGPVAQAVLAERRQILLHRGRPSSTVDVDARPIGLTRRAHVREASRRDAAVRVATIPSGRGRRHPGRSRHHPVGAPTGVPRRYRSVTCSGAAARLDGIRLSGADAT